MYSSSARGFGIALFACVLVQKSLINVANGADAKPPSAFSPEWSVKLATGIFLTTNVLDETRARRDHFTMPEASFTLAMPLTDQLSCELEIGFDNERFEKFPDESEDTLFFGQACKYQAGPWRFTLSNLSEYLYQPFFKLRTTIRHNVEIDLLRKWQIDGNDGPVISVNLEGKRRFADPLPFSRFAGVAKLGVTKTIQNFGAVEASQKFEFRYFDKTIGPNRQDKRFTSTLALHYKINSYLTLSPTVEFLHSVSNVDRKNFNRIEAGPVVTVEFGS